jgi:hypothetical protein
MRARVIVVLRMYYVYAVVATVVCVTLLAAAWLSIRLATADAAFRLHTPSGVARAVELTPRNTEYLLTQAVQLDYEGGDSTALLQRAADLNPLSSAPRIRLGLAAEIRGDSALAEKWLLDAARVDQQFEARWTLANFYFRQDHMPEFWKWMRRALQVSYGDRSPAFDLCWRASSGPAEILTRAIPDDHGVVAAYLSYLMAGSSEPAKLAAIGPVALKLTAMGEGNDRPALFAACDALINAGNAEPALALWRAMGFPKFNGVVNPDFEVPQVGHGFDWRQTDAPGIVHADLNQPRSMHRVTLNSRQPESCELLRQILLLEPQAEYTLLWESRTNGLSSPTGVEWRIAGVSGEIPAASDGTAGEVDFKAASELVPLTLNYLRPSGEPRAEGSVELWHVRVQRR